MKMDKIKLTKKDFDEFYEIEEITEEIKQDKMEPVKEDTTPEFLTNEEQEQDDKYLEDYIEEVE